MFTRYERFTVDIGGMRLAGRRSVDGPSDGHALPSQKPPLLLLHGHPQSHLIWRAVADDLAADFSVVAPDLRGYGASSRPDGGADHAGYSKRTMAADLVTLMGSFGHERFVIAAHDRGARVTARLCVDHPRAVTRAMLLDIAPTLDMYEATDRAFATAYWHWFFLIQPQPTPERLIEADPRAYVEAVMGGRHAGLAPFPPEVLQEYVTDLSGPGAAHGMCEDYRAAATIDLEHDRADRAAGRLIQTPLRVLWGAHGVIERCFDPLALWRGVAREVSGRALECGHYLPEEAPAEVLAEIRAFLGEGGAGGEAVEGGGSEVGAGSPVGVVPSPPTAGTTGPAAVAGSTGTPAASLREPPGPQGTGYDPHFLGVELPPAAPAPDGDGSAGGEGTDRDDTVLFEGQSWLPYEHFSVMLSATRRLARQVAWNIDVATLRDGDEITRSGIRFRADPRIPAQAQVLEDVYAANRLDRGHIARRADLLWGSRAEAERANRESFYFPNITPQMDSFNQSGKAGDWGLLENSLSDFLREGGLPRVSVFGGPVLDPDDPPYRGVQVPLSFWKLLAYRVEENLRCRAFMLTQDLAGLEPITFEEQYLIHGLSVPDLQRRTGLLFPQALLDADRATPGIRPEQIVRDPFSIAW